MINRTVALTIGAIALLVCVLSPWITVMGVASVGPIDSTELALVLGGAFSMVAFSAVTTKYARSLSIVAGLLVLGEAVHTLIKVQQGRDDEFGAMLGVGWGLYLAIFIGVFLIASTWITQDALDEQPIMLDKSNPYGRCATCGAPRNATGCTNNAHHRPGVHITSRENHGV